MYGFRRHHILLIVVLVAVGVVLWFLIFSKPAL
jgi:hypothetical protein